MIEVPSLNLAILIFLTMDKGPNGLCIRELIMVVSNNIKWNRCEQKEAQIGQ